jgi:uncharacterized protein (TIGR03083 family)
MNDTFTAATDIPRIEPGAEARRLATAMYDRLLVELDAVAPDQWEAETACAPWSVADIVRHLVGAAKGHASMRQLARQAIYGKRHARDHDGNDMDAMNALQVADHAGLSPAQLPRALAEIAPRAVAKRMSRPRVLHGIRLPNAPRGSTANGMPPSLRLGHLFTVILTRDVFLHRLDIARAVGREIEVDAATEGRLVADIVAEWAERHGEPFRLTLAGPAGGRYASGAAGATLEVDALELCWILSGRAPAPHPLLETRVLF